MRFILLPIKDICRWGLFVLCGVCPWASMSWAVAPYQPQPVDPILEPWRWRHMEFLAGEAVLCMDEAPDGSLWFGGVGALIQYDGVNVVSHTFDGLPPRLLEKSQTLQVRRYWLLVPEACSCFG